MSDTSVFDRRSVQAIYSRAPTSDGPLAIALGIIAVIIGMGAVGAGAWLAYGSPMDLLTLPGGLPATEAHTVSVYLVACGAITMLLGAISLYRAQEM